MGRWLIWIAVCGCYDPQPPAGAPCGTGGACPSNQTCDRGTCVLQPDASAATDAAPSLDATATDAGTDAAIVPPDGPLGFCMPPFALTANGCYAFFPMIQGSFAMARTTCQSLGSDLPVITTVAEAMYVATNGAAPAASLRVWTGIRRATAADPWLWIDDTPVTFFNWDAGEPNEALPCAASKPDGLWGDRGCDAIYAVACEK